MENIVSVTNKGALPKDYEELQISENISGNEEIPAETPEGSEIKAAVQSPDKPRYTHVRAPEIRRSGTRILMSLTSICGAAAGVVTALSGTASAAAAQWQGSFGEIFLRDVLIGAAFLAAEFLLGYFAFGDWLVWCMPLCFGMGVGLRYAAIGSYALLPCAAAELCAVSFAAAASAGFSRTLLRLSGGGTVYLERSPRKGYALRFLGYFTVIAAAALYEGIALNWG